MEILNLVQWSPEWLEARKWVITGTRLKAVVSSRKDTRLWLIYELIAELLAPGSESYKSEAMLLWNIKEDIVKEEYPDYKDVGFIKHNAWIGISPDAVKERLWEIVKALEIKSPEPKAFVRYALERWIPDEYYYQVIHYFIVIPTLEELDFVIFNPEMYDPKFRKRVIHVTREEFEEDIEICQWALVTFRKEWLAAIDQLTKE